MLVLKWNTLTNFLLSLILSSFLFAGTSEQIGTDGASQLLQPAGAKGIATLGANITTINSIGALYWNPAGLSAMQNRGEGTFSTMNIFNDIRINYAAVAYNTGEMGALAVSLKTFDFGNIAVTTNEDMDGESGQVYSPMFATIALSYAISLSDKLNVGLNAKIVHESIPRVSATAFAFDFGLQYKAFAGYENLVIAIVAKNIGTEMTYSGSVKSDPYTITNRTENYIERDASSNDLPASIEIGIGYSYTFNSENSFTPFTNFQSNNYSSDAVKVGLEYSFREFVHVRAGYNYETGLDAEDSLYRFAIGAGINYIFASTPISIDYAFRDSQFFDANNIFSITVGF